MAPSYFGQVITWLHHMTCMNDSVSLWYVLPPHLVIVAFIIVALWHFWFVTWSCNQKSLVSCTLFHHSLKISFTYNFLFETLVDSIKNGITKWDTVLQNKTENIYQKFITKSDRGLLLGASGITKYDSLLLQNASDITKCVRYYKVWQTVTTKSIRYYKVWQAVHYSVHQVLQYVIVITKWDVTNGRQGKLNFKINSIV